MSMYDKIATPKELLVSVRAHGLSTAQEDICRAQDIFGNAPIDALAELAQNADTYSVFYMVLFHIWNWEDATRFYNQHTNPEYKELTELRGKLRSEEKAHNETRKALQEQARKTDEQYQLAMAERQRANAAEATVRDLQAKRDSAKEQILKLKARLYDLIVEEEQ